MINIKNITKNFGNFKAVDNLNLDIHNWECFSLLWRNWAGKSTTIKMLVWLMEPTKWDIFFDNHKLSTNPIAIKSKLSYIPDMPYVYEKLTWIDFLYFVGTAYWMSKEKIKEKAEQFFYMFDFYEMIDKKIEDYSHWMKQKLVFTSALMHNPKYLILDEPMVALDYQWWYMIKKIITTITKNLGSTVIFTTHQIYVAGEISDRVWIIHNWKLVSLIDNKETIRNNLENEFLSSTWEVDEEFEKIITN